jgi:hypothetical protein
MGVVVTVQADSEQECAAELAWQCEQRGAEVILRPIHSISTDRWMARATVNDAAPDDTSVRGRPGG